MCEKGVNGYTNYETWNVAMWIDNDYKLYEAARRFMERERKNYKAGFRHLYVRFAAILGLEHKTTPDGIPYVCDKLNYEELDEKLMLPLMKPLTRVELKKFIDEGDGLGVISIKGNEKTYEFFADNKEADIVDYVCTKFTAKIESGEIDRFEIHSSCDFLGEG